jgi:hypothetical protein
MAHPDGDHSPLPVLFNVLVQPAGTFLFSFSCLFLHSFPLIDEKQRPLMLNLKDDKLISEVRKQANKRGGSTLFPLPINSWSGYLSYHDGRLLDESKSIKENELSNGSTLTLKMNK